jgi:hypothetical protein
VSHLPPLFSGERLIAGMLALAMSVAAIAFAHQLASHYLLPRGFQEGIDRPVLAIELPGSASDLRKVLGKIDSPGKVGAECKRTLDSLKIPTMPETAEDFDRAPLEVQNVCKPALAVSALRTNTFEDFLFIVLYTFFLWRFARLLATRANGTRMVLAKVVGWVVALATGLADCLENVGIIRALRANGLTDEMAAAIRWPSSCKWVLFGVALLLTSAILLRSASPLYSLATRRLLAVGYAISGALLFVGPLRPHFIESGTALFALLVFINMVALLGPYVGRLAPENIPDYVTDFWQRKKEGKADLAVRPHHGA